MSEMQDKLLKKLEDCGCYLKDHFKLVSGKHSDIYLQIRVAMMYPDIKEDFGMAMANLLKPLEPSVLAASTIGGILIAKEVADRLKIPILIGRQVDKQTTWLNLSKVGAHLSRLVLIDDIFTTGGTLRSEAESLISSDASITGIAVVADRSGEGAIELGGVKYNVASLMKLSLNQWDPSNCPICPTPYIDLHNPEGDFLSIVLSMPEHMVDQIVNGYREVFQLQKDNEQVSHIDSWKKWWPLLSNGLPFNRVHEDNDLVLFINKVMRLRGVKNLEVKKKRVLIDLIGHLLAVSNIKVEARFLGCSILIGDGNELLQFFENKAPVEIPDNLTSKNFSELISYYDALPETDVVFLFNQDGQLIGIKQLTRPGQTHGIQLLKYATKMCDAIGFVVRRGRKALYVYQNSRLEAIAELSEKTGLWEYSTPKNVVDVIERIIPGIKETLEIVLEISREMVARGYGGLFVVGDIPPNSLNTKLPKIKVIKQPIEYLGIEIVSEIAKLDGAVFISKGGKIQDASVIIINTDTGVSKVDPSKESQYSKAGGSRKEAARRTSNECKNVATVYVSQNGNIEIFVGGRSWPISDAITGARGQ